MANRFLNNIDVNGNVKITETAATSDTDKFVVLDSGVLKYRTGSQIVSDLPTDSRYVAVAGDTMSGNLDVNADIQANTFSQSATGTPRNNLGSPTVTEMALFDEQFNNKTAFMDVSGLSFWTYDGTDWTEQVVTETAKKYLVGGDNSSSISIPNKAVKYRIDIVNNIGYVFLNALYMYWSSQSHSTTVHIWKRLKGTQEWHQHTNSTTEVSSWPGHLYLPFSTIAFTTSNSAQYDAVRIEFTPTWSSHVTYSTRPILLLKLQIWGGYPAGKRNVYSTDENAGVTFPNIVKVNKYLGLKTSNDNKTNGNPWYGLGWDGTATAVEFSGYFGLKLESANGSFSMNQYGSMDAVGSQADFKINGVSINTAGTLTNVAYKNQNNLFSTDQTITGSGSTSSTNSLILKNSGGTTMFSFRNDSKLLIAQSSEITFANGQYIKDNGSAGLTISTVNSTADIHLKTNDVTRLTVDQDGKVGIGTTSPTQKLHVAGTIATNNKLYFTDNTAQIQVGSTWNTGKLQFLNGQTTYLEFDVPNGRVRNNLGKYVTASNNIGKFGTMDNFATTFVVNDSEKVRIDTLGKVGIGTTSPMTRLTVNNGIDRTNTNKTYSSFIHTNDTDDYRVGLATAIKGGATTADRYVSIEASSYRVSTDTFTNEFDIALNPTAGNVGIGTTSPTDKLTVNGNLSIFGNKIYNGSASNSAGVSFPSSTTRIDGYNGITFHSSTTTVGSQSERMRITNSGNVGIGTTTPSSKLDVVGYIKSSNNLTGLTNKYGKFLGTHYNISEQDVLGLAIESTSSSNNILIGGGFSSNNTATTIKFFTAANSTTTTGSEKMRINSDGNVGIGTTSPVTKLDVSGNVTLRDKLLINGADYDFASVESTSGRVIARVDTQDNIFDYGDQAMYIRSGNVGIGTTSPASKLDLGTSGALQVTQAGVTEVYVEGTGVRLKNIYTGGGWARGILTYENSAGTDYFQLGGYGSGQTFTYGYIGASYINNALRWYPNNNVYVGGNLGIGTTSPGSPLTVHKDLGSGGTLVEFKNSNATYSQQMYLSFDSNKTVTWSQGSSSGGTVFNSGTQGIRYEINGSEKLRITSTGNVGIGTTSPGDKLEVSGNVYADAFNSIGTLARYNGTGGIAIAGLAGNTYAYIKAYSNSGGTGKSLSIQPDGGNVGIGTTSPSAQLHLSNASDAVFKMTSGTSDFTFLMDGNMRMFNGVGEVVRITSAGNVGIGTTSPTQKLHVAGNGLFSGSITANGAQINNVDLVVAGAKVNSQGGYTTSSSGGYSIDGKTDADVLLAGGGTTPLSSISGSTPVTTKGDIYTYSTSPTRLPVGSDGKVLMANSNNATGLEWNDPDWGVVYCDEYALSDEETDLTTGKKLTFRLPFAITPTAVRISVGTAPVGSTLIVDINKNGVSMLTTKLSIDAGEKTSTTASSQAVINAFNWEDDQEITVDVDQIGSSVAGAGLKLKLYYKKGSTGAP